MTTTISITVTRTLLSLATLNISSSPYRVASPEQTLDLGTVTWRREEARSPYVEGAQLVGINRDLVEGCTIDIDVDGGSQALVQSRVIDLVNAFSQFTYTMTATLDGTVWAWTCQPADYTVGIIEASNIYGFICPVRFVFPRQPVPASGPY